ncbi:MAG: O-antigen ligase family protein [Clostridia bacterium]
MYMLTHSMTAYLLTSLIANLKKGFGESRIVKALYSFLAFLGKMGKESFIYHWFKSDVFTERFYKNSCFYSIADKIWCFVLDVIKSIILWFRKLGANSVTLYVIDKVLSWKYFTVDCFLAVFVGIMFATPHEAWNNLYAFLASCGFSAWIVINIAMGKPGRSLKVIGLCTIGFFVAICVSTVTALVISDAVRIALIFITSLLLAYSVYAALDTKEKLMRFLKIVLSFVTVTAIIGFAQRLMGVEVNPEFVDTATNAGMPGRVFSTFSNPNNFAELLLLFIPFLVPLFLSEQDKKKKLMVMGAFVIILGALAMTYSRSCWVGFALACVTFVLMYDVRLIFPVAIIVLVAIPLLPETIMNRIFTIGSLKDSSNSYRLYIWDSCLRMINDYGLTGLGLGPASFKSVYPSFAHPIAITAPHSHMLYMELILEMGVLGFVTFFGYMYSVVKKTVSNMANMDKTLKAVAIAGLSALAGIAFVCCAEYVWFYPRVMFAFWIVPGILMATVRISKKSK